MKFPCYFTRVAGGGSPTLATDTVPSGPPSNSMDNVLMGSFADQNGWPCYRVAVAFKGPAGGTKNALGQMYIWEDNMQAWLKLGPATVLPYDGIAFFDCVSLLGLPPMSGNLMGAKPGSIAMLLIVTDPNSIDAGTCHFAMAADLTSVGTL